MVIGNILITGAASLFACQVAVFPLLFKYSKLVKRKLVFTDCINYPCNIDYENPWKSKIVGGRNLYVDFKSKADDCLIRLGAWHIVPQSKFATIFLANDNTTVNQRLSWELQNSQQPIVVYCHGNANHRAAPMRIRTYKMLQELDFHVVTFDYRGYGDSTKVQPTEQGVVEDALQVYSWVQESLKDIPAEKKPLVLLWGHSLGTAVLANMVANMHTLCDSSLGKKELPLPDALVLEAPFNNLVEEIERHPLSKLVNWLPYYNSAFVEPLSSSSEFAFNTDQNLMGVRNVPILMLHSEGDKIVPYELAVKLHENISQSRRQDGGAPLMFHTYRKNCGLGHNDLCQAEETMDVVRNFIDLVQGTKKPSKSPKTPVFNLVNTESQTKIPVEYEYFEEDVTSNCKYKISEKKTVNTRSTIQLLVEKLINIQNLCDSPMESSPSRQRIPRNSFVTTQTCAKMSVLKSTVRSPVKNIAKAQESKKTTQTINVTRTMSQQINLTENLTSKILITKITAPKINKPETTASKMNRTETTASKMNRTETTAPKINITETTGPKTNVIETTAPKINRTETTAPEIIITETTAPKINITETSEAKTNHQILGNFETRTEMLEKRKCNVL